MKIWQTILILLLPTGLFAEVAFTNSIFDYQNEVIDFSEYGIQENVRSGKSVEISLENLKVGDIFIDADGTALKVVTVSFVDGEIIIETEQPELMEVFQFVSIPQQDLELEYYGQNFRSASSRGDMSILDKNLSGDNVKSIDKDITLSSKNPKVTANIKGRFRNNKSTITTEFQLPYTKLNTHGTWKPWKWTIDYKKGTAKLGYDCDLEFGAGLGVGIEAKKTWDILLFEGAAVDPSTVSGVKAEVYFWPGISGKITSEVQAYARIAMNVGGQCRLDGEGILCIPHDFRTWGNDPLSSAGFSSNVTLSGKLEAKFGPKISLVLLGISVASINGGAGPYLSGNAEMSSYIYRDFRNSTNNEEKFILSGNMEIGVCASVGIGMINDKISMTVWSNDYPLYYKSGTYGN
ncbi:MAG: hypothetical protein J6B11_02515 [Spirochaetales bacterium]|nr:hypothetical protein [Spirochaetales bacterium]